MMKFNTIEQEINRIRLEIHEETKDMTPQQITEYYRASGEAAAKKYGFKRITSINHQEKHKQKTL
ncbi:MAG: hypothetical protein FWG14_04440 [Peptococcaceae bacterium]|nr:hypothetical protein [Peptococcaceae bacterium]